MQSVEIDNRADAEKLEFFNELLGKQSPIASSGANALMVDVADPRARIRALPPFLKEIGVLLEAIERDKQWPRFAVEWASCRMLADVCNEAIRRNMSIGFFPEWPALRPATPIDFSTIGARGLHRFRSVRVHEDGKVAEVMFVNGHVCRVNAADVFDGGRKVLITTAAVGRRRSVVVLADNRGRRVQLTPHRILHLCDPTFTDE